MAVCSYYLRGACKYGDRCRNEHPGPASNFGNQTWTASNRIAVPYTVESIIGDITPNKDKPLWPFSSYGPSKYEPVVISGLDESPEELRLKAVIALGAGTTDEYTNYEGEKTAGADQVYMNARNNVRQLYEQALKISTQIQTGSVASSSVSFPASIQPAFGMSSMSTPGRPVSVFGQPGQATSTFGQTTQATSPFGQPGQASSAFGHTTQATSAFGQPGQTSSAFGHTTQAMSAFGQPGQATSTFGQTTQPTSAFSRITQPSSAFGQPSAFGVASSPMTVTSSNEKGTQGPASGSAATSSAPAFTVSAPTCFAISPMTSAFGGPVSAFGQPSQVTSAFGPTTSAFSQPSQPNSVFGQPSAFGAVSSPMTVTPSSEKPVSNMPDFSGAKSTARMKPGADRYLELLPHDYNEMIPADVKGAFTSAKFEWGNIPDWIPPGEVR